MITFDIGDVRGALKDASGSPLPVEVVEILESNNLREGYEVIDTQPYGSFRTSISTDRHSGAYVDKWYRVSFSGTADENGSRVSYAITPPIVPESVAQIVDKVRGLLMDTGDEPAFADEEYVMSIRTSLRQYKGTRDIGGIREEDVIPISLLCAAQFSQFIATDYAKYYQLNIDNANLHKEQVFQNYTQLARSFDEQYNNISKRLNRDSGGYNDDDIITQMPAINVVNAYILDHDTDGIKSTDPRRIPRRRGYLERLGFIDATKKDFFT